jgi:hypothetical protein
MQTQTRSRVALLLIVTAAVTFLVGFALVGQAVAFPQGDPTPVSAVNKCPAACNGTLCGGSPCHCDGDVCVTHASEDPEPVDP